MSAMRRERYRTWLRARAPVLGVLTVFVLVSAVQAWNMDAYPINFEDEGTYVAQAWAALRGELAHYTYWYDHPPGGWFLIAGWFGLTGALSRATSAVVAGREFMFVAFIGLIALTYLLCRRLGVSRGWSLFAVVLLGLSPLATYYHRIVLLDNISTPFAIAAFVLVRSPRRYLWSYGAAGAALGFAVYSKLTVAILLPLVLWELWRSVDRSSRVYAFAVFFGMAGMVVAMYPLMALLRGEFFPGDGHVSMIEATLFQIFDRPTTGSLLDSTSISAGVVENWLSLDPWLPTVGLAAGLAALAFRHLRPYGVALALQSVVFIRDGYLPFAYIVQLLPFMAVCLAGVPAALTQRMRARHSRRSTTFVMRGAAAIGVAALVLPVVGGALRDWPHVLLTQLTWDADAVYKDAAAWVDRNVPKDARLMVESPVWADLVLQGRDREDVVWFSKLGGLDPEVTAQYPSGWREFDYILTRADPLAAEQGVFFLPEVPPAMENSVLVAKFENPPDLCGQIYGPSCDVEIREIVVGGEDGIPLPGTPAPPAGQAEQPAPQLPVPGAPATDPGGTTPLPAVEVDELAPYARRRYGAIFNQSDAMRMADDLGFQYGRRFGQDDRDRLLDYWRATS